MASPLTRHQLLDGRIDLDDPDDYESAYLASERFHGTMMASLICHGDLAERAVVQQDDVSTLDPS